MKITIEFSNKEAAKEFATWLCEAGEQAYWNWMEEREIESDNPELTAKIFNYHGVKEGNTKQTFLPDGNITTVCGRLDSE